ncbi:MAG: NAD(+) synthase [Clostridia bacterium]|nr:NAD(+) synthase [Clostridia bacterium]
MKALKQREILNALQPNFAREGEQDFLDKVEAEICRFIGEYIGAAHAGGAVIGMSGGIDSFLVGALLAGVCRDKAWRLVAVMLPNGEQKDIADAEACCRRIGEIYPDAEVYTLNIGPAYKACVRTLEEIPAFTADVYVLGNLQPRLRMMYQYAFAQGLLVAGTDHCSEAVTGFYTKYGDGGTDFNPIGQLIKDDIFALSARLGAPQAVLDKKPAAGLGISEDDESELKVTYRDICRFLRGWPVEADVEERLISLYDRSAHKRAVPPTPAWLNRTDRHVTHVHCGGPESSADKAARYMNRHPQDQVLYAGTCDPLFVTKVNKTVNTPVPHYNCFTGPELTSPEYGPIASNVNEFVKISGSTAAADRLAGQLEALGRRVRRITSF